MIAIEDICEPEWADWYRMAPQERWEESVRLWHHYVAMGGSLDPEPDSSAIFKVACTSYVSRKHPMVFASSASERQMIER